MAQSAHLAVRHDDGALIQLEAARQALATVKMLPAFKAIRDKAEAIGRYAKQQQYSLEIQNTAAEIRLEAERRMGALLKEMKREQQGRPKKKTLHDETFIAPPKLEDLGISRIQSHRWQQEAALPEAQFKTYVADARSKGEELTSAAVLRQARAFLPRTTPRVKPWCIEDDVEAFYDLWERLWPHWQTASDRSRIHGTLRGLLAMLTQPSDEGVASC